MMQVVSCQSRNQFLWYCEWKGLEPDKDALAIIGGFIGRSTPRVGAENFVVLHGGKNNQRIRDIVVGPREVG